MWVQFSVLGCRTREKNTLQPPYNRGKNHSIVFTPSIDCPDHFYISLTWKRGKDATHSAPCWPGMQWHLSPSLSVHVQSQTYRAESLWLLPRCWNCNVKLENAICCRSNGMLCQFWKECNSLQFTSGLHFGFSSVSDVFLRARLGEKNCGGKKKLGQLNVMGWLVEPQS